MDFSPSFDDMDCFIDRHFHLYTNFLWAAPPITDDPSLECLVILIRRILGAFLACDDGTGDRISLHAAMLHNPILRYACQSFDFPSPAEATEEQKYEWKLKQRAVLFELQQRQLVPVDPSSTRMSAPLWEILAHTRRPGAMMNHTVWCWPQFDIWAPTQHWDATRCQVRKGTELAKYRCIWINSGRVPRHMSFQDWINVHFEHANYSTDGSWKIYPAANRRFICIFYHQTASDPWTYGSMQRFNVPVVVAPERGGPRSQLMHYKEPYTLVAAVRFGDKGKPDLIHTYTLVGNPIRLEPWSHLEQDNRWSLSSPNRRYFLVYQNSRGNPLVSSSEFATPDEPAGKQMANSQVGPGSGDQPSNLTLHGPPPHAHPPVPQPQSKPQLRMSR